MKKTLVASALAAVIFVPTASAIEVYKDDKNAVEIGGWIDARVINTQGATEVENGSSRINFGFTRDMGEGWKTFAKIEWGVNLVGNSSITNSSNNGGNEFTSESNDFLSTRLGYVGLAHDTYGSLTFGKQWGAWYDVVYNTNLVNTWDGNTSGTYTLNKADGAINGTGRGDKTVQYRNAFGDFSFAVQAQLKQDSFDLFEGDNFPGFSDGTAVPTQNKIATVEYNNTYGASATYNVTEDLILTAGANVGEFEATYLTGNTVSETDLIFGAGATWGEFNGKGFYGAVNVNKQEYHDTDNLNRYIPEAWGMESLFSYKFDNGLRPLVGYNILEAGDEYGNAYNGDVFKRQFLLVGLHYVWDDNTMLYLEGRKDFSDFTSSDKAQQAAMEFSEDDGISIGIRYYM
ncbi:Outer membrane porin, putative [Shewanella piezotolerans WP3]|uniref:Outer membrane porin, putative n=1 Tax=Shewanella piezotolerans (strain WP3 / JCM 13877) TaxID=225849 RepID=B8CRA9_SHEPW|nr:porin [Shewanella piezotolerans]ACJ29917.1 Outer membrane porin, putative [Shewanella piezotolerans WP3]